MTGISERLTAHEWAMLAATVGPVIAKQDEADLVASLHQLRTGLQVVAIEMERFEHEERRGS